jgi:hypothetical protein
MTYLFLMLKKTFSIYQIMYILPAIAFVFKGELISFYFKIECQEKIRNA